MRNALVLLIVLILSCAVGNCIVVSFLRWLRRRLCIPYGGNGDHVRVSQYATGYLERLFFTIAVVVKDPDVLTAMMAWLAVKLAANWGTRMVKEPARTYYTFSALLAGFCSMLIAYLAGLLIRFLW